MICHGNLKAYTDDDIDYGLVERKYLDLIKEVKKRNSCNLTDIDSMCEAYIVEILNVLYGWKLQVCEQAFNKNFDAIDRKNRIVVQITSNNARQKIENTLIGHKQDYKYNKYKLIYFIIGNKKKYMLKNKTLQQFIKNNVIDANIILNKIKEHSGNSSILSKVYDNIVRIHDSVGMSRNEIKRIIEKNINNKQEHKNCMTVRDDLFDISLQLIKANNIFDYCYGVLIYNDIVFDISEDDLSNQFSLNFEEFCDCYVHEDLATDYSYVDLGHVNIYIDKHKIFKIYNLIQSVKDKYYQTDKVQKAHAGIDDCMVVDKQNKKVKVGSITGRQWNEIISYAENHIYREKMDDDYIFYRPSNGNIFIGGHPNIKYKGTILAVLSIVDKEQTYNNDDREIELWWSLGNVHYNSETTKFDNVYRWQANYTKKYIEDKILKCKIKSN